MLGIFIDGKKAPNLCVIWHGGTGFSVRGTISSSGDFVIRDADLNKKKIDMRKPVTHDRVLKHVESLFDKLSKEEIPLWEIDAEV